MRKRQIYSLALALTLSMSSLSGVQPVMASSSKTVIFNQLNAINREEVLSFRTDTAGVLEVVVPLENAPFNIDFWEVKLISNSNSYKGNYSSFQEQTGDVTVLSQYLPAGEYFLIFSNNAMCKINFAPMTTSQDSKNNNLINIVNTNTVDNGEPEEILETPPTITVERENFNKLAITIENVESENENYYVSEIELYERIGNGEWNLKRTFSEDDLYDPYTTVMKKINQKYQYKARVVYESYNSESDDHDDYIYGAFSEVKEFFFKKELPKPTFKVKRTSYEGEPAVLITPKKYDYAHGVEVWSSQEKEIQDLNLRKYDSIYLYGTGKHTVKIRSYRYVNSKKIYSPWTDAKTIFR